MHQGLAAPVARDMEAMSVDQAREWVWSVTSALAELPPPSPQENDNVGFAPQNNGPLRTFLANGRDQTDAAYFGAVEYLKLHAGTQLEPGAWSAAFRTFQAAAPRVTAEQAKLLIRGGAESTSTSGSNKNGTWEKRPNGVALDLKRTVKYANIGKDVLTPAGLHRGSDYEWHVDQGGSWTLIVFPHALERVIEVLEANGREAMGASLRAANLTWEKIEAPAKVAKVVAPAGPPTMAGLAEVIAKAVRGCGGYTANVWTPKSAGFLRIYVDTTGKVRKGYYSVTAPKTQGGLPGFHHQDAVIPITDHIKVKDAVDAYLHPEGGPPDAELAPEKQSTPIPSTFTAERAGSNLLVSSRAGVLDWLKASQAKPGWYVVPRADVRNVVHALKSAGRYTEADIVSGAYEEVVDLKALSNAVTLDDPRINAATRAKARELVAPVAEALRAGGSAYELRPYQEVGVAFLLAKGRGLIGDDMGVGKTAQAIGAAAGFLGHDPKTWIIVCPASAVYMWRSQINAWLPWVHVLIVKDGKTEIPATTNRPRAIIVSWNMQTTRIDDLIATAPTFATFDEAHYAKNYKAKRTIAAAALADAAPKIALLTGTPAENTGAEVFNQLRMIDEKNWPSFPKFRERYFTSDEYGTIGGANLATAPELRERLKSYMVRRLKSEVLDLPPKQRNYVWIPMDPKQAKAYHAVLLSFKDLSARVWKLRTMRYAASMMDRRLWLEPQAGEWVLEQTRDDETDADKLVLLGYLRRAVGKLKIPVICDMIEEYGESSPKPLVVFVEHGAVVAGLRTDLEERGIAHAIVDGSTSAQTKADIVDRFQAGEYRVLVATRALREAVTLTAASDMIFGERWWVPTTEEQAEDRIYRSGARESVGITFPMLENTLDEHMHRMILRKRGELDHTVGGNRYEHGEERGSASDSPSAIYDAIMAEIGVAKGARTRITEREWSAFLAGDDTLGVDMDGVE